MNGPTGSPSDFDGLIKHGIKLLVEVRRLEASKKLTAESFVDMACRHAGIKRSKLEDIERAVAHAGIAELDAFLHRVASAYAEPSYPIPFPASKFGKALVVFGREGSTLAIINAAKLDIGSCLALAAHHAARQHPDRFGDIQNWTAHQEAMNLAHDRLAGICAEISRSWTMNDVDIWNATPDERQRGLVKLSFKEASDLHPGMPDFPMKLIERAAAESAGNGKPMVRRRLAETLSESETKSAVAAAMAAA